MNIFTFAQDAVLRYHAGLPLTADQQKAVDRMLKKIKEPDHAS